MTHEILRMPLSFRCITLEMDGAGHPTLLPVHQLASNIAPTVKPSPQGRHGIGTAPESARWYVRDPLLKLISHS